MCFLGGSWAHSRVISSAARTVVPNQKLVLSGPRSRQRYQVRRGNLPADYGGRPAIGRLLLVS